MIEYDCPHCGADLKGGIGDNVYCGKCDKSYVTDWEYLTVNNLKGWLTGIEYSGNK